MRRCSSHNSGDNPPRCLCAHDVRKALHALDWVVCFYKMSYLTWDSRVSFPQIVSSKTDRVPVIQDGRCRDLLL